MVAVVAVPPEEGQATKAPTEAVAQVLTSTKFLRNVGLEIPASKKSTSAAYSAQVQELQAEVQSERKSSAALQEKMDDKQTELQDLKLKFQESKAARENQMGEIESLKKQGEETNALLRRLLCLNRE